MTKVIIFFFSVRICAEFVSPRHSFFTSLLFWILICPCCCYRNMPQGHFWPPFLAASFYRHPSRRRAPHRSDPAPAPEAWPSAPLAHSGPRAGCRPMVSQAKALGCCTSCPNQLQVQPTFVCWSVCFGEQRSLKTCLQFVRTKLLQRVLLSRIWLLWSWWIPWSF